MHIDVRGFLLLRAAHVAVGVPRFRASVYSFGSRELFDSESNRRQPACQPPSRRSGAKFEFPIRKSPQMHNTVAHCVMHCAPLSCQRPR